MSLVQSLISSLAWSHDATSHPSPLLHPSGLTTFDLSYGLEDPTPTPSGVLFLDRQGLANSGKRNLTTQTLLKAKR